MLKWVSAFLLVAAIAGLGAYYFVAKPDLSALLNRDGPVTTRAAAPAEADAPSEASEEVEEVRYALLIANEDYPSVVGRLKKPHEDVARMAAALRQAGFPGANIRTLNNANQTDMNQAVAEFASLLRAGGPGAVGFFYYSGHGGSAEKEGTRENYLIPAKTSVTGAEQLPILGVPVSGIVDSLALANAKAVFIVSDACRNTLPITSSRGGAADKGMVQVPRRSGVYIAFATADGATTPDDGLFSEALAEQIVRPGQTADRAFTLALRKVASRRPGGRLPFSADGLKGDICFAGCESPIEQQVADSTKTEGASGSSVDAAQRMQVAGAKKVLDLVGHNGTVQSTQYSPDGKKIVTTSTDKTARIWDSKSGSLLLTLSGHEGSVFSATFSPNGTLILTVSADDTAKVWDTTSGALLSTLRHNNLISAWFNAEGTRIVVLGVGGGIGTWDIAEGHSVADVQTEQFGAGLFWLDSFDISSDRKNIVGVVPDDLAVVWDLSSGQLLAVLREDDFVIRGASFSPNAARIVTGTTGGSAKVWDASSGRLQKTLAGHTGIVNSESFSPDGTLIVTTAQDGAIVWDAYSGNVLHKLRLPDVEVLKNDFSYASFSPHGKRILTEFGGRQAPIVWDTESGSLLAVVGHNGNSSAAFSPDGKRVVTGNESGVAEVWELDVSD